MRVQMCMNRCENKEQTGDDEEDEKASIEEIIQNTQQIILLWNKILKDEHLRVSFVRSKNFWSAFC